MVILSIVVIMLFITVVWLILDRHDMFRAWESLRGEVNGLTRRSSEMHVMVNGHASQLGGAGYQLIKLQERVMELERAAKPTKPVKRATRKRGKTA